MNKVRFVLNEIKNGKFEILPENISIGPVYKIKSSGSLDIDGIERGFLFIPTGSGIKYHFHNKDLEVYRLIMGNLKVYGNSTSVNICGFGAFHGIDVVSEDTIVETCKMNDIFLKQPLDSYYEKYSYLRKIR